MATAEQKLALLSWPPEGRTLGDLVEQLAGPKAWLLLTDTIGDRLPSAGKLYPGKICFQLTPEMLVGPCADVDRPFIEAIKSCHQLLELWNSGALTAKGRRGGRLEHPVEIVPPGKSGWQVVIYSLASFCLSRKLTVSR